MQNETLFDRLGGEKRLRLLLQHFYADVRQHRVIGPVFAEHVADWPEHIERIAGFWKRITGGTSSYTGNMPAKHLELGLNEEHFKAWLTLWEASCRSYLQPEEAEEMVELAHAIARRLQIIVSDSKASRSSLWAWRPGKVADANSLQLSAASFRQSS